jgi:DNA-binding MarR family transcriptional regulator
MRQDPALPALEDNVGYMLKVAATALHSAMESALREFGLTVSQYACIEHLSRTPGLTNAQLARAVFVTPQSMNEVLRGLQRRGIVERPGEAESGRRLPARLTPAGQQTVEAARRALGGVDVRVAEVSRAHPGLLDALHAISESLGR